MKQAVNKFDSVIGLVTRLLEQIWYSHDKTEMDLLEKPCNKFDNISQVVWDNIDKDNINKFGTSC